MNNKLKQTVNMFRNIAPEASSKGRPSVGAVLTIVIIIAAMVCLYGFTATESKKLDEQISSLEEYVYNTDLILQIEDVTDMQGQIEEYNQYDSVLQAAYDSLVSQSAFHGGIYDNIVQVKPERVSFTGLSFKENTLTIECITQDNLPPADFAQALDELKIFDVVEYQGFSGTPADGYVFTIACVLQKGGESA